VLETVATFVGIAASVWVFDWYLIWYAPTSLQERRNRQGRSLNRASPAYRLARMGLFAIAPIGAFAINFRDHPTTLAAVMIALATLTGAYVVTPIVLISQRNL